jgi:2'-5' RNA ligase
MRPFRGHLTIARLKHPHLHAETRARIEAATAREFGVSTIREMTLYRSTTTPGGSIYQALRNFEFNS